jgi:nucleolar protein 14
MVVGATHIALPLPLLVWCAAAAAVTVVVLLQVLYGILVQHFALLAGAQPLPTAHLDVLTKVLLQITPEVPFYAATVARTRIEKMQERLAAALKDPLTAAPLYGWPGPRQLLQLRLFSCLFPTSDKRHPVTSPLALLLGKQLLQCPVSSCYTAAVGLLVAGMALHNAAGAARFCPEVVNYLAALLNAFVPAGASAHGSSSSGNAERSAAADSTADDISLITPGLLALRWCTAASNGSSSDGRQPKGKQKNRQQQQQAVAADVQQLPRLQLHQLLSCPADSAEFQTDEFKLQLLCCTVATASRVTSLSQGVGDAAPEVLQPLLVSAAALSAVQGLPPAAVTALNNLQQEMQDVTDRVVAARLPVVQSHRCVLQVLCSAVNVVPGSMCRPGDAASQDDVQCKVGFVNTRVGVWLCV